MDSSPLMLLCFSQASDDWNFRCFCGAALIYTNMAMHLTVWPSGLRRWLQAPVRKGVGSNPTAVTCILKVATARVSARMMGAPGDAAPCRHLVALPHPVRQFGSGERCSLLLHPAAGQHQNPDVCVASGCAGEHRAPAHMARLLGRPRRSPGCSLHIHPARIELATFSVLG